MIKTAKAIQRFSINGRSKAQTALRFALAPKVVASAVVGIRTIEQLKDVVGTLDIEKLTTEELDLLKISISPNQYEQHR